MDRMRKRQEHINRQEYAKDPDLLGGKYIWEKKFLTAMWSYIPGGLPFRQSSSTTNTAMLFVGRIWSLQGSPWGHVCKDSRSKLNDVANVRVH